MIKARDLHIRIQAEPFRPFRLMLTDGTKINVTVPRMFVGPEKALVVTKWTFSPRGFPIALDMRTVPLDWISEIIDLPVLKRASSKRGGRRNVA